MSSHSQYHYQPHSPQQLKGNILTPSGWLHGQVQFGEKISALSGEQVDPKANRDHYIIPGFIDLHVHGAGGKDTMEAGDAITTITRTHAQHGTTSLLATTMTAPLAEIEQALQALAPAVAQRPTGTARVLGVHLEGPYINPGKLGAQPDFASVGSLQQVQHLNRFAPIKLITVAPEVNDHLQLIAQWVAQGIRVQLGHTLASYEEAVAALEQGASSFTHLYNAMSRFEHRAPGAVGAALAHAQFAEVIPDLIHVHPGAIKSALRAIPQLYCVTDSTSAAGMPDGTYMLGRQQVHKCMGGVRLADGTLAGSTLTMDQALRNMVSIGLDLADASRRVSTNAADYLGLPDRGRVQLGAYADMVVLDRNLHLLDVFVEGERIVLNEHAT